MSEKNYTSLVNEVASGSIKAYEKLFYEFYASLVLFSEKITNDKDNSECITQEVFCKIWDNRKKLPEIKYLKTYLYTSVRNKSLTYLRDIKKFNYNGEIPDNETYDILSEIFEVEVHAELYKAIGLLPPKCKKVIRLKLKGLKDEEISSVLGVSKDTVRNHVKRGYREIRKEMKDLVYLIPVILGGLS